MAKFKITTDSGTYQVEADDAEHAAAALDKVLSSNYSGPEDASGVPEGMVLDPKTGAMVDARAIADQKGGSMAGAALKGMPLVGQWADEIVGMGDPVQTEVARQMQAKAERDNPKTAFAAQLATGATAIPAAVMTGSALPMAASGAGSVAAGLGYGAAAGAGEGFVSGLGAGKGSFTDRLPSGGMGAAVGGSIGGVLGAAAPVLSRAIGSGVKSAMDAFTVNRNAAKLGVSRQAADVVTGAMRGDDTLGGVGARNIAAAGPDGMLADAGISARTIMDTAAQKAGPGARIATTAVEERAAKANTRLNNVLDVVLGKPNTGLRTEAKDIASSSRAARSQAYKTTYAEPIDYASAEGAAIEDVVSRVPQSILKDAISEANDQMVSEGRKNMQIMANIADDGTVTFKEMPNVEQLDQLKRALGSVADKNVDQFGRRTAAGNRAADLAQQLRDAVGNAVPSYKDALKLGGDKIAEDKALRLGYDLLRPSTTRETVIDGVKGITDAERKRLKTGLRQYIDDTVANVTKAMTDTNMDAREAAKALKDMSSRAAREKISHALGQKEANVLFSEMDKAEKAISLKAAMAQNSKTFARDSMDKTIKAGMDGPVQTLLRGEPLNAGKRAIQMVTGATDDAAKQAEEQLYAEVAKLMTGPRGPAAIQTLQRLQQIYGTGLVNKAVAQQVGRGAAGAVAVPLYQSGMQSVRSLNP